MVGAFSVVPAGLAFSVCTSCSRLAADCVCSLCRQSVMARIIPAGKGRFMVRRAKRKYAFEVPDVPREEAEYLELVYSYRFPALPADISGQTFSR